MHGTNLCGGVRGGVPLSQASPGPPQRPTPQDTERLAGDYIGSAVARCTLFMKLLAMLLGMLSLVKTLSMVESPSLTARLVVMHWQQNI